MRTRTLKSASIAVLIAATLSASAQNLVTNGSFETDDFTGFTTVGNPLVGEVTTNNNGKVYASDGSYYAFFYRDAQTVEQVLPTVAGQRYAVSFDLIPFTDLPNNATPASGFQVTFGGQNLLMLTNPAPSGYVSRTLFVTSTTGNDALDFTDLLSNRGDFGLDNIRVVAAPVPEPSALAALGIGAVALTRRRRR